MQKYSKQSGMMMVEALMAILIFSLGILGVVGINALAVSSQSDAQYRTEANKFANQIINKIWVSVDRTSSTTSLAASVDNFKFNETAPPCGGTSTSSALSPDVTAWANAIQAPSGLPGATAAMQQIITNTGAGGMNEVTVTVCWRAPGDQVVRKHVMKSLVN